MLNFFNELLSKFGDFLVNVLPVSPFRGYIDNISELPYLPWLNWFLPIRAILIIFTSWLSAVALFYLYSIIMRWVKVIGD